MVENKIEDLILNLNSVLKRYRDLLDVLKIEHSNLKDADIPAIQKISFVKEALINDLASLEQVRIECVGRILKGMGKDPKNSSLEELITLLLSAYPQKAEKLKSQQVTLRLFIKKCQAANEENQLFVQESLKHVNKMKRNLLGEGNGVDGNYTRKGQRRESVTDRKLFSGKA